MTRGFRRFAWFIALALITTSGLAAQGPHEPEESRPTFTTNTELVPLDVRVLDKSGRPVLGLTSADFSITEDGRPQRIAHFSIVHRTAAASSTASSRAALVRSDHPSALLDQPDRIFLLYLGRGDLVGPAEGVDGIRHFVRDRLLPQDYVAVMAWNRATDFTTDHDSVLAILDTYKDAGRKIEQDLVDFFRSPAFVYGDRTIPPVIQTEIDAVFQGSDATRTRSLTARPRASADVERDLREETDRRLLADTAAAPDGSATTTDGESLDEFLAATAQTMQDEADLYAGIEYLRHVDGEKHLVWLTEYGLRPHIAGRSSPVEAEREIGRAAASARVVLDIVRAGGTASTFGCAPEFRQTMGRGCRAPIRNLAALAPAAVSRRLADLTGGRSDANRFRHAAQALDLIDRDSRDGYLLGYYPSNTALDGRFRAIAVTVNRPDVSVLVRKGYYATPNVGPLDRRAAVTFARVLAAAEDAREIPDLAIPGAVVGEATSRRVSLTAMIDLSRVTFTPAGDRFTATLHVAAFCLDARQQPVGDVENDVVLNYDAARLREARASGVSLPLTIPVTAPASSVKLVVYDFADDLTGSRNVTVGAQ
jgi:VWFA-related protein